MKQFHHKASAHLFSWTLIFTLTTASILQLIHSQPQRYFRGNNGVSELFARDSKNKITPLPSKALPRIGRRNGGGNTIPESDDENYGVVVKEEETGNIEPIRTGLVELNAGSRFTTPINSPQSIHPGNQSLILLLKYLLKYGVIRPEDYPIFFRFNSKSG